MASINPCIQSPEITAYTLPPIAKKAESDLLIKVIKSIALTTFKEIAAAALLTGVTCFFVSSPIGMAVLIISAIAISVLNLTLRIASGAVYVMFQGFEERSKPDSTMTGVAKGFCEFSECIAPLNFAQLNLTTRDVLVHESGHALAAHVLYKNARPKIEVFPFQGGVTKYFVTPLSKVGRFFGEKKVHLIVAGAGPAAAVIASSIDIGIAQGCRQSNPRLSRYLNVMAGMNLLNHLAYAYSAFAEASKKMPGHDFVALWAGGIHPYVSMTATIALPLIVKTGVFIAEKCHHQRAAAIALPAIHDVVHAA